MASAVRLSCSWDGEWTFAHFAGRTLAIFPHWTIPGLFCIGRQSAPQEFCLIDGCDDFENEGAAVDHAEWLLSEAA